MHMDDIGLPPRHAPDAAETELKAGGAVADDLIDVSDGRCRGSVHFEYPKWSEVVGAARLTHSAIVERPGHGQVNSAWAWPA